VDEWLQMMLWLAVLLAILLVALFLLLLR